MPRCRSIDKLPENVRHELDTRLRKNGFGDYHAEAALLTEQGFAIGKSALHQHGQELKKAFHKALARAQVVEVLMETVGPQQENALDKFNNLVLKDALAVQVNTLSDLEDTTDPMERAKLLNALTLAQDRLSRSGVHRQKWDAERKALLDSLFSEAETGDTTLDMATLQRIRREVYGLAA